MSQAKILYVLTQLELGGAQKHLLTLIQGLGRGEFSPYLFTGLRGELFPEANELMGAHLRRSFFLVRHLNPFADLCALVELAVFIRKHRFALVHTHSSKAGIIGRWAARLAGVSTVVHTVHGWSFNEYQPFLLRGLYISLERLAARLCRVLIVVSEHDRQKGLRARIGVPAQYRLIRYGIESAAFELDAGRQVREELGIPPQSLVVGMVSCLKPQKSPLDFVRMARVVRAARRDVSFVLVGDGRLRNALVRLIRNEKLQGAVVLTGWRRDIPRLLSALDVVVLTSLWEGFPIAVLEAMASGKPVVATDTGGIGELVEEGKTGFLTVARAPGQMAQKVLVLLRSEETRRDIGVRARAAVAAGYRLETMVATTLALYRELVSTDAPERSRVL